MVQTSYQHITKDRFFYSFLYNKMLQKIWQENVCKDTKISNKTNTLTTNVQWGGGKLWNELEDLWGGGTVS